MSGGWGTPSWMGGVPTIGETFVAGKDRDTARALLAAADDLGIDRMVVRTANGGFVVPDAVYDRMQEQRRADSDTDF